MKYIPLETQTPEGRAIVNAEKQRDRAIEIAEFAIIRDGVDELMKAIDDLEELKKDIK